jgi:hypothetical protein
MFANITCRSPRHIVGSLTVLMATLSPLAYAQNAPEVTIARVPNGGIQPQIVAKDGVWHLAYLKGDAKASDVFYARSTDGQNWSAPLRVNSQAGSAIATGTIRGAHLTIGRNGRVFVAWNGSNTAQPRLDYVPEKARKYGTSPFLFTRLKEDGSAFEPQRNLMTKTFNLDGGGSLAADDEGRVYAVWHANDKDAQEEAGRRVWIARSTDNGATFSTEAPVWNETTGVCACCQLRLLAENGGKVTLLYRSAGEVVNRDSYALRSTDAGATYRGSKIHDWKIGACPMSSYALAKDSARLLAAWESSEQVFFAPLSDDMKPQGIAPAPGQGDNRKHPVLAVNNDGQILLAWTEGTGWARGGMLRWQLFDAQGRAIGRGGEQNGVPVWSYSAAFARPDGGFTILY